VARRIAEDLGVDPDAVRGSGPRGRVVAADVQRAAQAAHGDGAARARAPEDLVDVRWSAARRLTARRMAESAAQVAPVTLHRRVDAAAAEAAVKALKASGLRATFNHAVMWAAAGALARHPAVNAVWDGDRVLQSRPVHLGVAVDVDGDLHLAVIRDAGELEVPELVRAAAAAVGRVRRREAGPEETRGATFTVSNLGMLGVEQFTPIVNLPQVAILGVGAITEELVLDFSGIARRPRCHLSLTFDHRAVDGAPAARFLAEVARRLESFGAG
jgi:pyruvate dehydrogenase E2 component (dihydrolipoamide acetyltransferase)